MEEKNIPTQNEINETAPLPEAPKKRGRPKKNPTGEAQVVPAADEPKADDAKAEPIVEKPKASKPKKEKVAAPAVDEPKADDVKAEPITEKPKASKPRGRKIKADSSDIRELEVVEEFDEKPEELSLDFSIESEGPKIDADEDGEGEGIVIKFSNDEPSLDGVIDEEIPVAELIDVSGEKAPRQNEEVDLIEELSVFSDDDALPLPVEIVDEDEDNDNKDGDDEDGEPHNEDEDDEDEQPRDFMDIEHFSDYKPYEPPETKDEPIVDEEPEAKQNEDGFIDGHDNYGEYENLKIFEDMELELEDVDRQSKREPNPDEEKYNPKKPRKIDFRFELIELFVFTFVIILILTTFIFKHSMVEGESMLGTLEDGDHLIISDLFYEPKQYDIIVCEDYTTELQKPIVKRVIATEGQHVLVVALDEVYVDGELVDTSFIYIDGKELPHLSKIYPIELVVPEGEVFVMGDHRNDSLDSRHIGTIKEESILGKVLFRFMPFDKFGKVD